VPLLALVWGSGPLRMVPHVTRAGEGELQPEASALRAGRPGPAGTAGRGASAGAAYDPAMLLAIDAGNTNVTFGLFRGGVLTRARRAATSRRATADEVELLLEGMLALDGVTLGELSGMACASVVPAVTHAIEQAAVRRGLPLVVASAVTVPLPIRVDRPGEVGADRLVNALAAVRLHGAPAVVVDLGTATTFDCVATDGAYVGGAIAAGLELGLEALATHTAQLPRIELLTPDRAIGRNTVAAMQAGTIFGYQALVNGLLDRIRRELAEAAGVDPAGITTILTGGLAAAPWAADLEGIGVIDPDLTLKGLAILHAEVAGGVPLDLGLGR
jgi:type III pantothenate kinase